MSIQDYSNGLKQAYEQPGAIADYESTLPEPTPEVSPPIRIQTELAKFNVSDAAIAEMKANFLSITVAGHTDKANAKLARERRLEVKALRVAVEKTRKELKEDSLRVGQAIDKEAKRITAQLEPIEKHLQEQEDIVARYQERLEAEERARITAEQQAEQQRLEAERAKLEAERAEIERQRAEMERAQKVNAQRETVSAFAAAEGMPKTVNQEFQHTPGPWIDGNTSDSIIVPGSSNSPDSDNDFYGGCLIAESVAPHNKALIKAAPDLLAAAQLAAQRLCDVINSLPLPVGVYRDAVEAGAALQGAIAKAVNQQPEEQ